MGRIGRLWLPKVCFGLGAGCFGRGSVCRCLICRVGHVACVRPEVLGIYWFRVAKESLVYNDWFFYALS